MSQFLGAHSDVESIPTFDEMNLNDEVLRGIYQLGFEIPTSLQQRAIKPIVKGQDVTIISFSGESFYITNYTYAALILATKSYRFGENNELLYWTTSANRR